MISISPDRIRAPSRKAGSCSPRIRSCSTRWRRISAPIGTACATCSAESQIYTRYYARKLVRLLSAEELHDAIALATGQPGSFKFGSGTVGMAMQPSGPGSGGELKYFMQTFGQANRNNPPKPLTGSPLQPLLLMQSAVVTERVLAKKDSRIERLLESYRDDARLVEEMFLGTLARPPSEAETQIALAALARHRVEGAQNLQWALINLTEFFFNY
jgi:hypothetical protein